MKKRLVGTKRDLKISLIRNKSCNTLIGLKVHIRKIMIS